MSRKRIGKKKHNISGVSKNLTCAPNQSLAIPAHGEDTLTSKIVFWSQSCALWTCYLCPAGTTAPAKMWLLQMTKNDKKNLMVWGDHTQRSRKEIQPSAYCRWGTETQKSWGPRHSRERQHGGAATELTIPPAWQSWAFSESWVMCSATHSPGILSHTFRTFHHVRCLLI